MIEALRDRNIRWDAAKALGEIKDARAVEPLIEALKEYYWGARSSVAEALGKIKDIRAVVPLISVLKDEEWRIREDWRLRRNAALALAEIKDARAVEPLIEALKDKSSFVRWRAALTLDMIGTARAGEALNIFLKDRNLKKLAEDYKSIIKRGKKGTEGLLIFILHGHGSETMAEDFFHCGEEELRDAAMRWAERHEYTFSSARKKPLLWGSSVKKISLSNVHTM